MRQEKKKNPEHGRKTVFRSRDATSIIMENTRWLKKKKKDITDLGLVYRFDGKKWRKFTSLFMEV